MADKKLSNLWLLQVHSIRIVLPKVPETVARVWDEIAESGDCVGNLLVEKCVVF